jgi:lambda family phage tail tape measure protein
MTTEQSIGTARLDVVVDMSQFDTAITTAKNRTADMSSAAQAAYAQLNTAEKRRIDTLLKQADTIGYTRQQQILYNAALKGAPTAILDQLKAKLASSTTEVGKAGHAVEEFSLNNSNARRELGRLTADLANGNFGRFQQTALTLANYSGLMSKAFGVAGLAVLGTTAILGGFLLAEMKGEAETSAFIKSIILTGNSVGVTANQLDTMASNMSRTIGTQGEAAATLAAVTSTGKFTADQLGLVAVAAEQMQRLTGQATEATIQQFEDLANDPVAAILKLNDSQHFLTAGTYEQIKAMQDQGHEQEAATLAIQTYATTVDQRTKEVTANLGLIEKGWTGIKEAALAAADAALNVGRRQTDQQKFDVLFENRTQAKSLIDRGMGSDAYLGTTAQKYFDDATKKLAVMQDAYVADQKAAATKAKAALLTQDQADSDAEVLEFATNAQKRAAAILKTKGEYDDRIARAVAAGDTALAAKLRASEKLVEAGINQKFKDPKQAPDPEKSAYATFFGQVGELDVKNLRADSDALTQYEQGIAKLADEMAVYMSKGGDATKAAALFNRGQQDLQQTLDANHQKEIDAEKQYAAALDKSNAALQLQVNNEIARIGMGDQEYHRAGMVAQAYQDQAAALADLALKRQMGVDGKLGGISQDQYEADVQALRNATDEKVQIMQDGFTRMDAAQDDWKNGAIKAYEDFVQKAGDVAGQTDTFFSNTFDNLTDAVVTFETTGKGSIKSFVTSALTDFARMETRIAASKILQSILGAFLSGSTSSGEFSNSDALAGSSVGGGYSGYGMMANAKGGAYYSPSLSAYSSQIVDRPTTFAFARGAGVMGEAGPEGIMPLARDSQGRLGVRSQGGDGGGNVYNFSSNVTVTSDGTKSDHSADNADAVGKQLNAEMTQAAEAVLTKALRPGGILWNSQKGR